MSALMDIEIKVCLCQNVKMQEFKDLLINKRLRVQLQYLLYPRKNMVTTLIRITCVT